MGNEEEGFEDWDADFLDQLIQVEELALSSAAINGNPFPSRDCLVSYSPPRELSQRVSDFGSFSARSSNGLAECAPSSSALAPCFPRSDSAKELEICNLKRELGRVSKQLKDLEQECVELRLKRNKKEEQLKIVASNNGKALIDHHCSKSTTDLSKVGKDDGHSGRKSEVPSVDLGLHSVASSSKSIGVQVEKVHISDGVKTIVNEDLPAFQDLSKKLQVFWIPKKDSKMGQNLVSELLLSCEADFHVLFGCISTELSVDSPASGSFSDVALKNSLQILQGREVIKLSNLYATLTKVSNGISKMEALVTPLLDLCNLDNVAIVHRSLHILHMFLKRLLSLERKSERRKTVIVEGLGSRNNLVDFHGSESGEGESSPFVGMDETSHVGQAPASIKFPDTETVCRNRHLNNNINLVPCINWVSLFELMHQVAKRHSVECVRTEAVSIMNLILMRNNAYVEREKFGQSILFESVLEFIRKESGLSVQKHAVRLLFLILNCPAFFVAFCSGCKVEEVASAADDNGSATCFQKFSIILHGLADCLTCCGNGIEELQLRRNTVLLLAFLASSGKAGFEILISNKLSTESSFLVLILQVVVSEVERENKAGPEPVENLRERALLIREVLILLNRLASHSLYSATVLRLLTNNRDMVSLTMDVLNKLSRKLNRSCQFDSKTRQMRESELADLVQVFKKRVLTYLGSSIS